MTPRVRFAPSPTGHLHVGGARTALFNYLFARHTGGSFLLRIEDTDRQRSSDEMTLQILESMEWLGLTTDEAVVHQADGVERHRAEALALLEAGEAYRSFLTPEELAVRREGAAAAGDVFTSRSLRDSVSTEESLRRGMAGEPFAVYFAVPEGETAWDDAVHGPTTWTNENIDDFVILRSDGTPVYNMAVVSDDVHMGITHVIRGDDHLSNTPKQIRIYRALGAPPPVFAHVPMILGPDGKRLSKRHGATSVESYREEGILPSAMANFLGLLGWSPGGDREVMDLAEMIEAFTLDRILKKSGVFDVDKLVWLNGRHLDRMSAEEVTALALEAIEAEGVVDRAAVEADADRFDRVLELVKPRARTIRDVARQAAPFFAESVKYDEAAVRRHWKNPADVIPRLTAVQRLIRESEPFDEATLEIDLRELAEAQGVGAGKLIHPLRVALMGVAASPGIFEVLVALGRERSLRRIEAAIGLIGTLEGGE